MRKKSIAVICGLLCVLLVGCAGITPPYSSSPQNIVQLRQLMGKGQKIRLGDFSGDIRSSMCRLDTSITPPEEMTFAEYFKKAFETEFIMAGVYDQGAEVVLSARVLKVQVDSVGTGSWNIQVEFHVTGQSPFMVEISHPYRSAFAAYQACQNARSALPAAVQELISKTITHPVFEAAFKN